MSSFHKIADAIEKNEYRSLSLDEIRIYVQYFSYGAAELIKNIVQLKAIKKTKTRCFSCRICTEELKNILIEGKCQKFCSECYSYWYTILD